jgi:glycosyltransferase involved in cell wall biosynthesis
MLRLLISAPGCNRDDVGESWVAYQWVERLARRHDVTLLTYYKRDRVKPSVGLPGVRVVEWPEPPLIGRAERLNSLVKPGYFPFHVQARRWIKGALRAGERFDIAHQPVPVAMRYPSPFKGLGIPYVIGPVGGSLDSPPSFPASEDTAAWYVGLRNLDRWRMLHDPSLRGTYEQAACVLGIAPYVKEFLDGVRLARFEVMSETGVEALAEPVDRSGRTGPVRLLFVGRLIRTKGARDAIRAMSLIGDRDVVLDVVGEGFDREACERLVAELGLTGRVVFHGWQSREAVDGFYRAADVFVFPSYREPGGNVAYEAMAHGLPLIVNDRGGPGACVDDTCGIRVHADDPRQYAEDIAKAVIRLTDSPGLRLALGRGARERLADTGLWDSKVLAMEALYRDILGR